MEHQDELGTFSAVITAAGQASNDLALRMGVGEKCAAHLAGEPICRAAIEAVLGAGASTVAVVCGPETRKALGILPERCIYAEPGGGPVESAQNGYRMIAGSPTTVFLPGDLPFVRADHVVNFVQRCPLGSKHWVAAAVCSALEVSTQFPGIPGMKYSKLSGTKYAAGGIFAASQEGFETAVELAARFSRDRKSMLRMSWQFGFVNMLKFLAGAMSLGAAEQAATRLFGCEARIVTGCAPEFIADVDTIEDWEFTKSIHRSQVG
jgi:CTP:molybdopterin cytidylyltransferase MocA